MQVRRRLLRVVVVAGAFITPISERVAHVAAEPSEPPAEWTKTSDDSVMPAHTYRAINDGDGPFQPILAGAGFNAYDYHNMGSYTIRLVTSADGNIEEYRDELQQTANEINAAGGATLQVAAGTVAGPADPNLLQAAPGEIWVMIASNSPCGALSGGRLGCGGPDSSTYYNGQYRWSSGTVWLRPNMSASCRQPVASHEVSHALGLAHFDAQFEGKYQVMRSSTNCVSPIALQSGDLNGHRWLVEGIPPAPSHNHLTSADTVCPVRSTTLLDVDTTSATSEAGEPAHAGVPAHHSVWYRYTAQFGGTTQVDTANNNFNTVLAVYTGSMFASAVPIASNNDFGGTKSRVTFTATVGATYWIALDGTAGARGVTDVIFTLPAGATVPTVPAGTPTRLLDTRRPGGQTFDCYDQQVGRLAAGSTYQLTVTNRAYVVSGATSVVLNVTAVAPAATGYITVFPCDATQPNTSSLNFTPGDVIPNLVISKVSAAGKVCFFTSTATDLLVDVSGFNTSDLTTINPARLLDTRPGGQTADGQHAGAGAIQSGTTYELPVLRGGVNVGAATVVLNVTAAGALTGGFVTVFPCGQARPNSSNLNFSAGDTIPNAVVAKVGALGKVCFYSETTTDLLVDVNGYFMAVTTKWTPLAAPARMLDTRTGGRTTDGQHQEVGRISAGGTYELPVTGRLAPAIPSNVTVVMNVTAVAPDGQGYITVYPCGLAQPNASNLNFVAGDVIPNSVIVKVGGGGSVCFFTSTGVDLIVDVSGYFVP